MLLRPFLSKHWSLKHSWSGAKNLPLVVQDREHVREIQ